MASLKALAGSRLFFGSTLQSSSSTFIPGFIPRLNEILQNIPEIKIRLEIPFGNKKVEQEVRGALTGLNENGLEHKDNAQSSSEASTGVSMIPEEYFYDNGILLAVPKKKVSHRRKRNHQLGPGDKHQKEIFSLDRCPSCGHIKRRHTLCMHCVSEIKVLWKERAAAKNQQPIFEEEELSVIDEQTLYPKKVESEHDKKLREKEYLYKPPRTFPYEPKPKK